MKPSLEKTDQKTNVKEVLVYDTIWQDGLGKNNFKVLKLINDNYEEELNVKIIFNLSNDKGEVKLLDSISDCPVEFHLNFIKDSFTLLDKNYNNQKELLFAYVYTCRGDMTGDTLRVIGIENNKLFNIKGIRTNIMDEMIAEHENRKYSKFGQITEKIIPKHIEEDAIKLWLKYSEENNVKSRQEVNGYYENNFLK